MDDWRAGYSPEDVARIEAVMDRMAAAGDTRSPDELAAAACEEAMIEERTLAAAGTLFDTALADISSASIRAWAQSQRDLWLQITAAVLQKNPRISPCWLTAYIICTALG